MPSLLLAPHFNASTSNTISVTAKMMIVSMILLLGCVSFFCTQERGGKIGEKRAGERQEHESQEEQTGAESADATGERRTARRAGDDPMEERAPESDLGRDRSGGR